MPNVYLPAECPRCRMALRVRTEYLGRWVACRYCGELFQASAAGPSDPANRCGGDAPDSEPAPGAVGIAAESCAEADEALEFAAERHRFEVERQRWEDTHRAQADEIERTRDELAALASARDELHQALQAAQRQAETTETRLAALAAEQEMPRPTLEPLAPGLLERLTDLQGEVDRLRDALTRATAPRRPPQLPILRQDLERWSIPSGPRPVAMPVGPPPLPPSLDDIQVVEEQISMLRALLRHAPEPGKAYHTLFDLARFQALQQKLKEAQLLADRLLKQVERSKTQKDFLWHLMLAQRNDEINRRRR